MAYPNTIQSRESLHAPINNFATVLAAGVNAIQTSVPIATRQIRSVVLPEPGMVSIGSEVIYYDSINHSTLQLQGCIRGFDNTIASPHGAGERVEVRWVAAHHNALADLLYSVQIAVGAGILNGADQLGAGQTFATLAAKLALTLPESRVITPATTSWSIDHYRRRVVGIQLYEYDAGANKYYAFEAPNTQTVDPTGPSPSTVAIEPFAAAKEGVIIIL